MKKLINFFKIMPEGTLVLLTFIIILISTIIYAVHCAYITNTNQKYLYDYILYKDVKIIERPKECENVKYCDYLTTKGKMNLNDNIFYNVSKEQKFDIGIKIGTCYSNLYAKIYTNDVLQPFYKNDIRVISSDDDSYLVYKETFKLPNQPKCE